VDLSSNNIGNEGAFQILESLKVNNTIISVKLNSYEGMFRNRIDARGLRGIEDVLQINKTLQFLNLSGSGIGYEGCRILARGLEDNESLLSLDISNNELGPNIALPLAKSLITSQVIELNIAGNKLGDPGALNLFYMFSTGAPRNAVIQNLDISSNNISTMGVSRIFDALGRNGSVKEFNISNNNLGGKGIVSLANLFWDNRTIKVFQISNCDLGFDGADAIATGLTKNLCIESLNVSKNTFKDEGAIAIAAALKENTHIKSLDMSGCRIREEGGKALADYIKGSGTLVKIELKDNTLYDEAGRALHEAMKQNQILRKMSLDRNPIGYTYLHEI
jgi:Ran GTPase-activating protein (RanGAP) involved in mRNA processing and transport